MNKYKLIKILALVVATLLHFEINAQNNTIIRKEGHFFAVLDFTPASGVYNQKNNRVVNPSHQQFFPNEYIENNITVKGMVKGAMLSMDWWTLFGEPVENYNFQWTTTGQYYVSEYGGFSRTVTRNMVAKYPDLLMRFDALKPLDVKFTIYWRHSDEAYKKRLHYTFSSSNRNQSVSTNVTTGLLFEPSGKEPLSVPGIRQGKGLEFIDKQFDSYQHYNLNEETKKSWLEEFNKANSIIIDAFYATEVRWPVGEMKAIAELYDKYEKGEADPTPMQLIENELKKSQNLTTYNNNDFWGEAFEDEILNISIESKGSEKIIKNNNLPTFKTDQYHLEMFSKSAGYDPNKESKFLIKWSGNDNKFRQKYKHHIFLYFYYLIDFRGNIISIDGKNEFYNIRAHKNEQGFYEALYFTDEWTYVRDICYTAGSGGLKLNKIEISNSFDEAKTKLLNHSDNESGCANGSGWSKFGIGKFIKYYLDDKMQVIKKKTEYHVTQVYNY